MPVRIRYQAWHLLSSLGDEDEACTESEQRRAVMADSRHFVLVPERVRHDQVGALRHPAASAFA